MLPLVEFLLKGFQLSFQFFDLKPWIAVFAFMNVFCCLVPCVFKVAGKTVDYVPVVVLLGEVLGDGVVVPAVGGDWVAHGIGCLVEIGAGD